MQRHRVDQRLHRRDRLEMARGIEQQPAPGEPRRVVDVHGVERGRATAAGRLRHQLRQRDGAVEQARVCARGDSDALRCDVYGVAFFRRDRIIALEDDRGRLGRGHGTQSQAAHAPDQIDEIAGRPGIGRHDRGAVCDLDPALRGYDMRRQRDHGGRRHRRHRHEEQGGKGGREFQERKPLRKDGRSDRHAPRPSS